MMKSHGMFLLFVTVALINEKRMDEGRTVPAAALAHSGNQCPTHLSKVVHSPNLASVLI